MFFFPPAVHPLKYSHIQQVMFKRVHSTLMTKKKEEKKKKKSKNRRGGEESHQQILQKQRSAEDEESTSVKSLKMAVWG